MAIVLFGTGLVAFPTLGYALLPVACFVGLATVEGHLVTPTILGRRLTLNPFAVLLALAFWTWLWGPMGAFLAVPLSMIALVISNHLFPSDDPSFRSRWNFLAGPRLAGQTVFLPARSNVMSNMARDTMTEAKGAVRDAGKAASAAGEDMQADLAALRDDVAKLGAQLAEILQTRGNVVWRKAKSNVEGAISDAQDKGMEALGGARGRRQRRRRDRRIAQAASLHHLGAGRRASDSCSARRGGDRPFSGAKRFSADNDDH